MDSIDWDDPERQSQWLEQQLDAIRDYLASQGFKTLALATTPEWFVAPYVGVWPVRVRIGATVRRLYLIAGDLPTDYIEAETLSNAREAIAAFGSRWQRVSENMRAGKSDPELRIGDPHDREQQLDLADLLSRRAGLLTSFAQDASLWP